MAREVDGMVTATGGVARRCRALRSTRRVAAAPVVLRPRSAVRCNVRVGATCWRQILPAARFVWLSMWDCRCMDHQILTINNMVVVLLARAHRQ